MDVLSFKPAFTTYSGSHGPYYRHFYDILVSGESLRLRLARDIMGIRNPADVENVPPFGWQVGSPYERERIEEFLGQRRPELYDERTCFFVCCICADIGCRAYTGRIDIRETTVVWQEFWYESGQLNPRLQGWCLPLTFTFDRKQYFDAFRRLQQELYL